MANWTEDAAIITRTSAADLTTSQYRIVKRGGTARTVVLATASTDNSYGVLANAPAANGLASVYLRNGQGTFKVVAGGTIAIGAPLTSDSQGRAITATAVTAGATPVNHVIGYAEQATSTVGEVIEYMPAFEII